MIFTKYFVWSSNIAAVNDLTVTFVCHSVAPSTLPPSSVNYFAANEAYQPLAILDLLETTMQIYHGYRHHGGNGSTKNDTSNFTMGVVLVALTEDQFNSAADAFSPNRLRPAYSMQGK